MDNLHLLNSYAGSAVVAAILAASLFAPPISLAEDARLIPPAKEQGWVLNETMLGFASEPGTDALKAKLLDLGANIIRIGDNLDQWTPDWNYPPYAVEDPIVEWGNKNGVHIIYLLSYCPHWANALTREKLGMKAEPTRPWEAAFCPPDDPGWWKEMCKRLMTHYKGKVFHYEVWNEPNSGFFPWAHAKTAELNEMVMQRYVDMCKATYEAAKEVDPKIKVWTCAPHNDFFGAFLGRCFGKGVAAWSDGILLHIYVGPQWISSFDVWWARYMETAAAYKKPDGAIFPVMISEFGYNRDDGEEPAAKVALTQTTVLLGSGRVEGATRFHFHAINEQEKGYALYSGDKLTDSDAARTLRQLHILFNGSKYQPLAGASISPGRDGYHVLGTPWMPDNKFYAFEVTRPDKSQVLYLAAWRGRFDYGKSQVIDIPDQAVTITLPVVCAKAQELCPDGNLKPFTEFKVQEGKTKLQVTLDGIKKGKEGQPKAFFFYP